MIISIHIRYQMAQKRPRVRSSSCHKCSNFRSLLHKNSGTARRLQILVLRPDHVAKPKGNVSKLSESDWSTSKYALRIRHFASPRDVIKCRVQSPESAASFAPPG